MEKIMALIKCKECRAEISSGVGTCPKCGARVKARSIGLGTWIVVLFLGALILSTFSTLCGGADARLRTFNNEMTASFAKEKTLLSQPADNGSQWSYSQSEDSMSKGHIFMARVKSSNTVSFDFPYSGAQHGTLSLRTHPRYGEDLIFRIEKGQILCNSYESCDVLIRFDNDEPIEYATTGTEDGSTETIFISDYSGFVRRMLKAKKVRISVTIFQEGSPIFEFDVSDFDQSKYLPNNSWNKAFPEIDFGS
jgi:hypothetical protein